MKKNILTITIVLLLGILISAFLINNGSPDSNAKKGKKISFKVYGNCGMCKKTIEESLKNVKGINSANWDVTNKIMVVYHDPAIIAEEDIHKKIAASGYDTELIKGDDDAYGKLHSCCQYERKK